MEVFGEKELMLYLKQIRQAMVEWGLGGVMNSIGTQQRIQREEESEHHQQKQLFSFGRAVVLEMWFL